MVIVGRVRFSSGACSGMATKAAALTEDKPRKGGKRATPPGHVKVFKTAVFKIHNPSKRKRAMLIDSMTRCHLAYERLLNRFMPSAAEIERLGALSKKERRETMRELTALVVKVSRYPHLSNNGKDAIRVDALAQIASTIGLQNEQESVGMPTVARINASQVEYEDALEGLVQSAELMDENQFRDGLLKVSRIGTIRPLNFVRTGISSGFMLLRDPVSGKLWTWLNLHPEESHFARRGRVKVPHPEEKIDLINMKTGEFVDFSSKTGERFALEMGHSYHDAEYLLHGEPQTARLYWRTGRNGRPCNDFELHVTFQFVVPKHLPRNWLGVDRGVYNLAAYAVVDDDGRVVDQRRISGMELRFVQREIENRIRSGQRRGRIVRDLKKKAHADEAVHVAANTLVEACRQHEAQLVLEDLRALSGIRRRIRVKGRRRSGFNVLLNRTQYEKLKKVLSYKLTLAGLSPPIFVRPAFTSQTCPECGHVSSDNRVKTPRGDMFVMDKFRCVHCGHEADADENAARVIAMKGRWLTTLPRKSERKSEKLADELRFDAYLKDAAARRSGA